MRGASPSSADPEADISDHAHGPSVDAEGVAVFSAIADQWWDPKGKFAPLHHFNPIRLGFIRDQALTRFGRDSTARQPFEGLRLIDIGCGGGLLSEPMARLGFQVTGLDASARNIAAAKAHADKTGLSIDYRCATAESLVEAGEPKFDVVLAMEVVEHVADPKAFLSDCMHLLKPGGILVTATLNRTLKSLALAKIGAEYVLRWLPIGAHDWRKFLTPEELRGFLAAGPVAVQGPFGVVFHPLTGKWSLSDDSAMNYMMTATKD